MSCRDYLSNHDYPTLPLTEIFIALYTKYYSKSSVMCISFSVTCVVYSPEVVIFIMNSNRSAELPFYRTLPHNVLMII